MHLRRYSYCLCPPPPPFASYCQYMEMLTLKHVRNYCFVLLIEQCIVTGNLLPETETLIFNVIDSV